MRREEKIIMFMNLNCFFRSRNAECFPTAITAHRNVIYKWNKRSKLYWGPGAGIYIRQFSNRMYEARALHFMTLCFTMMKSHSRLHKQPRQYRGSDCYKGGIKWNIINRRMFSVYVETEHLGFITSSWSGKKLHMKQITFDYSANVFSLLHGLIVCIAKFVCAFEASEDVSALERQLFILPWRYYIVCYTHCFDRAANRLRKMPLFAAADSERV